MFVNGIREMTEAEEKCEIERLHKVIESLSERLRDRDNKISALFNLATKHGIDCENLTEYGYSFEDDEPEESEDE